VFTNDFEVRFKKILDSKRTAALEVSENGSIKAIEQSNLEALWANLNLAEKITDAQPTSDHMGGIKQRFTYKGHEFSYVSLKNNNGCYFVSLINTTIREEIFRSPCLIDPPDFNGSGGGYVDMGNYLLFALGSMDGYDENKSIRALSQDMKSPYGKILSFHEDELLKKPKDIKHFRIYSLGHRNIQGMLKIGKNIYAIDHGPKGGDGFYKIKYNLNYGWPAISMGSSYRTDKPFPLITSLESGKYQLPLYVFIPSVGTSDISECPVAIKNRYKPFECALISSIKGKSIFIVLFDSHHEKVISMEKILFGGGVREIMNLEDRVIISSDNLGVYEVFFKALFRN
jgi:hypothetical protein